MDLAGFVGGSTFAFLLVLVRLGAAFLVMPGIGEQFVSTRIRLLFAVSVTLLVTPVVSPMLPPAPPTAGESVALIISETLIGLFIGILARTMLAALEVAGFFIATQLGLGAAQAFNPALAGPSTPIGALLGILALVMMFATDLHHLLIEGLVGSYMIFKPGVWLPIGDASQHMTGLVAKSFLIGIQMSAPFIVLGLLFYLGLGLVARLVPSIQVFFIGIPIQTLLGTLLLMSLLSAMMLYWLTAFEEQVINLLGT